MFWDICDFWWQRERERERERETCTDYNEFNNIDNVLDKIQMIKTDNKN